MYTQADALFDLQAIVSNAQRVRDEVAGRRMFDNALVQAMLPIRDAVERVIEHGR